MAKEDAFNAAKAAFSFCGGFFKDAAQEIGMEKAVSLWARQGEAVGALLAGMTKQRLGDREIDLKTFVPVLCEIPAVLGMTAQIEENPNSVRMGWPQCPVYEGLQEAGLDHATIEAMCSHFAVAEFAELKKAFPQLSGGVKFRPAPDQPCVEEFVLRANPSL